MALSPGFRAVVFPIFFWEKSRVFIQRPFWGSHNLQSKGFCDEEKWDDERSGS